MLRQWWLGDKEHAACKKLECWFVAGVDLTGALHVLRVLVVTTTTSIISCCSKKVLIMHILGSGVVKVDPLHCWFDDLVPSYPICPRTLAIKMNDVALFDSFSCLKITLGNFPLKCPSPKK